ncbi:uncharacterized protein [Leptinotarsa decemlineata]|uniref:uncharacterized protein n=1 Tax=Leptinotarsa decemlineata TaxID=7539 RepID=UPI003D306F3C
MSDSEDAAVAAAAIIIAVAGSQQDRRRRRPRRFWVRPSLVRSRKKYSTEEFMKDLLLNDVDDLNLEYRCDVGFRNFFRMSNSDFENILRKIAPVIIKQDTKFRPAISVSDRLTITLRFLATGDSYVSLGHLFKISKQAISADIVPEVCDALTVALRDYVKVPRSTEEWDCVEKLFNDKWNYPNCVGAIDGKHINIQAPANSGTEHYNYKGFFSIVLLAVVDANYNFKYANVGCQGRISDGVIVHTLRNV